MTISSIGSGNGLAPIGRQAIIWTNVTRLHIYHLKIFWRPVLKTCMKTWKRSDPSSWRRIFKVLKTTFLDVLKPNLDALFQTVKYCLQHAFIAVWKTSLHDNVIKWKHVPRYWPFVRGIPQSPVTSPHKGQWRGALMFSLISARINGWVNNGEACDLRRHRTHYDVIIMEDWPSRRLWRFKNVKRFVVLKSYFKDIKTSFLTRFPNLVFKSFSTVPYYDLQNVRT